MTATAPPPVTRGPGAYTGDMDHADIGRGGRLGIVAFAVVVALAFVFLFVGGFRWIPFILVGFITYLVATYVAFRRVVDAREAKNEMATAVVTGAFALVLIPLVSVSWTVIERGLARFDVDFFTQGMRGVIGEGGGGYHAIVGTLVITGIATLLSVPIGLMVAIYLVEYGKGRLAQAVTTMVDVMTGIPSIVAGLFAFSLFVTLDGPGHRSGLAGGIALALLMTPVVIRASEEMIRLVPNDLREASYALGVPKWKTIVKVVIPTAIAGILTGITLAIARVIGETAPLLLVAGLAQDTNWNPFEGRMTTLPVFAYYEYATPSLPPQASYDRAWTAALTLVILVAILFFLSRVIAKVLQPKGLR